MAIEGFIQPEKEVIQEYTSKGYWKGLTSIDYLKPWVEKSPEKLALADERKRFTYAEFNNIVDRLSLHFLEMGIKKEDRVALQLPNWCEFVLAFYALTRIGAIPVSILHHLRHKEVEYILKLTEVVAVLIPSEFKGFDYKEMMEEILPRLAHLRHIFIIPPYPPLLKGGRGGLPLEKGGVRGDFTPLLKGREGGPKEGKGGFSGKRWVSFEELMEKDVEVKYSPNSFSKGLGSKDYLDKLKPDPNDLAVIMMTGGTTADPKGVPYTHNHYFCTAEYIGIAEGRRAEDIFLVVTPIAHNAALLCGVNASIMNGATVVLTTAIDLEGICTAIEKEKATRTLLVPTQAIRILNYPDLGKYDLSSLKTIVIGGAKIAPEAVREITSRLNITVVNILGMTEGFHSCTRPDDPLEVISNTVGRPACPGDEFKLIDEKGQEVPRGKAGELIAKGPTVLRGYFKSSEHNKKAFTEDGFYRTGDLCQLDTDGNIMIIGRVKDMILRGGENISPVEIEELLMDHPLIEGVSVVGMPDKELGERVCAYIKPKGNAKISLGEVVTFLKGKRIASFKLPERVEIVQEFPLTNVGKISKKALREDIIKKSQIQNSKSQKLNPKSQ